MSAPFAGLPKGAVGESTTRDTQELPDKQPTSDIHTGAPMAHGRAHFASEGSGLVLSIHNPPHALPRANVDLVWFLV